MPADAITLAVLANELHQKLSGARINKIVQPEKDEIVLFLRSNQNLKLILSANSSTPRCHLTEITKESPANAPAFCMLLRKHLSGGLIQGVQIEGSERVLRFEITASTEMKDVETKFLFLELIGKFSNLILTDEKFKIISAIKFEGFDVNTKREILGGLPYRLPPAQDKIEPTDSNALKTLLSSGFGSSVAQILADKVRGISFASAEEIACSSNVLETPLSNAQIDNVISKIHNFFHLYKQTLSPNVLLTKDGMPKDFFAIDYQSLHGEKKFFNSLNEALDFFYTDKDNKLRVREKVKHGRTLLKNAIARTERKIALQEEDLDKCSDLEKDRILGELITSNIYRISPNQPYVEVQNYYENNEFLRIPLDVNLTPSQNAQRHFKSYAKKKRTIDSIIGRIDENRDYLKYLRSIEYSISTCDTPEALSDIFEELKIAKIYQPKEKKQQRAHEASSPFHYRILGHDVFVGKNNVQNDRLTNKFAKKNDIWMHSKSFHGSHVIIENDDEELNDDLIVIAAEIAAFYSEGRSGRKIGVDYTFKKHLKKPPKAVLGYVTYSTNWTVYVDPNEHPELKV